MLYDGAQTDTWQADALRCMVRDGNRGAVQRLVRNGACVFADSGRGRPLLSLAARHGHKDIIEFLLQQGVDVNKKGPGSETALHAAIKNGHTEVASILMKRGADVTVAKKNGRTALHLAARLGLRDTTSELVQKNADVNACDDDLWTALHEAARYGHFAIALVLIEAGAKVDAVRSDLFTPLHSAARYGHLRIALTLIEHGADVNAVRIEQWTPLLSAVCNHHTKMVEALIQRGANVNDQNYSSCTALHLAALHGHVDAVSTLIQNGANINATQDEGRTPLHLAAINNHSVIVALLIANGANKAVLDKVKGWSAFNLAASYGHVETVAELLNSGAPSGDKCNVGNTPLHSAVEKNRLEVAERILEQGCAQNFNVRNEIGLTPLHYACLVGSEEMAKKLIEAGACMDIKDDSGRTPMDFVRLKPVALKDRLENVFQLYKLRRRGPEGKSEADIGLQSGHRTATNAGESTYQSLTDLLPCSPGQATAALTHGTSSSSSISDEWSAEIPFSSKKQTLARLARLKSGYSVDGHCTLESGVVDGKPHIRFVRGYGKKALVVKFYHEELRFANAKKIYDKVAGSAFVCKAVKPLCTSETGQPCGMVLKRGSVTLADWLQSRQQSVVDRRWCLHHILNGIKELHLLGIVHTNLKPSKIMFFPKVVWKLIGLDRARMAGTEAVTGIAHCYAAPELLRLSGDDSSSLIARPSLDMWSFGAIAYELITGNKLFAEVDDFTSVAAEIYSGKVLLKLEEIQVLSLREMLTNVLEIDPASRWTTDCALQSSYFQSNACTTTFVSGTLTEENSD